MAEVARRDGARHERARPAPSSSTSSRDRSICCCTSSRRTRWRSPTSRSPRSPSSTSRSSSSCRELNLDIAGEYLVMAATLMLIKSRMLLPADPDDEDEAEEDPRAELVQQLLEYQRYREAAVGARRAAACWRATSSPRRAKPRAGRRPGRRRSAGARREPRRPARRAARRARSGSTPPRPHEICAPRSCRSRECVRAHPRPLRARRTGRVRGACSRRTPVRGEVIVTFLALLELIRLKVVRAVQHERFGPIALELARRRPGGSRRSGARDLSEVEPWRGGEDVGWSWTWTIELRST